MGIIGYGFSPTVELRIYLEPIKNVSNVVKLSIILIIAAPLRIFN